MWRGITKRGDNTFRATLMNEDRSFEKENGQTESMDKQCPREACF